MNAPETWAHIEEFGQQRASKNCDIFEDGREPTDTFTSEGVAIHNPWESSCGRFEEIDPYVTYGRSFVMWLLIPFYEDQP